MTLSFVEFQTPEEFFLGESPVKFEWRSLDPIPYVHKTTGGKQEYHSKVISEHLYYY